MKSYEARLTCFVPAAVSTFGGCSSTVPKSPDVADSIRRSLDQSNLKDVSVSQDRDKGVVTSGGHVANDSDNVQVESIAKSMAAGLGCPSAEYMIFKTALGSSASELGRVR
jgi:hypothetical protein